MTFLRGKAGKLVVAWMVVVFMTRDNRLRRRVDIRFLHKFVRIPSFEDSFWEWLLKKGYGIVSMNGKVMSECLVSDPIGSALLQVHYKMGG